MTVVAVLIGVLVAAIGLLAKLWRGAAAEAARQKSARDAQAAARTDDAGRFESVIAAKNAEAEELVKNTPRDISGIREAVKHLGGKTLPEDGK